MNFLLSLIGFVMLAVSVLGVIFGVFMAINFKTRDAGKYFALWWVPGAAAASGVIMKDIVTFTVGFVCFCVAGAVFGFEARRSGAKRSVSKKKRGDRARERSTAENKKKSYRNRRAAS